MIERLHKVLARAGVAARRKCEDMIREGRVMVDGRIVMEMGLKVDPDTQEIRADGVPIHKPRAIYLAFHKPRRVLSISYPHPRERTLANFIRGDVRLFPVGRLDRDSEGLLLLTNDGGFCNMLAHPRYQVPRTYHVVMRGAVGSDVLARLRRGVWLAEGRTGPIRVKLRKRGRDVTVASVTVHEGMNREIRRAFAKFGIMVMRLRRVQIGPLTLGRLAPGEVRVLKPDEVEELRRCSKQPRRRRS